MESPIEELIVALACISGNGCSETTHVYYFYNPIVKERISHETKKVNNFIGNDIIVLAPIAFVIVGGSGSIKLSKYISLDLSKGEKSVSFKYDF